MKLLMINTSPHERGATERALSIAGEEWQRLGGESEIFFCKGGPTFSCVACGLCKHGNGCFYQDAVNELRPLCEAADAFIFGSPVHYGGATGTAKSVMGRLFRSSKEMLRRKPAFAVAVGRRSGHIGTLVEMEKFFAFNEMPIASSTYFTIIHAAKREDVEQDGEGVEALKNGVKNLYWLSDMIRKSKSSAKQ